jgi:hypothetical protein
MIIMYPDTLPHDNHVLATWSYDNLVLRNLAA